MKIKLIAFLIFFSIRISAQKKYEIHKISSDIKVDGIIDEIYLQSQIADGFIQKAPLPGKVSAFKTEVRLLYDDEALYVFAQMYDSESERILKEYVLRDGEGNADRFGVILDTYNDGINAFQFMVSASGVQSDSRYSSQGNSTSWDAIWESHTRIVENGWIVEMKIPFSSLRFSNKEDGNWGLQLFRDIRRFREESYWNEIKPEVNGTINQSGILSGVSKLKSPLRLSLNPYAAVYSQTQSYETGPSSTALSYAAGADVKYGINDAFTLDMTLIPDFGQVISDRKVLNLTPFEVFFEDNRPFFTEGLELFDKGRIFYTRRIGGSPYNLNKLYVSLNNGDVIKSNPLTTKLINATKFSGRTKSGLGIGMFNGIVDKTNATVIRTDGNLVKIETNPLTNYNVFVADQNLPHNSYITLMNANTTRFGSTNDANVTALLGNFRDKKQDYEWNTMISHSNKYGGSTNVLKDGFKILNKLGKVSGKWTYSLVNSIESENYDPNDLGFLFNPNENNSFASVKYSEYKPKSEKLILYNFESVLNYERLWKPGKFARVMAELNGFIMFKSRFATGFEINVSPLESYDYFEPRNKEFLSPLIIPPYIFLSSFISSDYRKKLALDANFNYSKYDQSGRRNISFAFKPRIRWNDHFTMKLQFNYGSFKNDIGYVSRHLFEYPYSDLQENDIMMGQRNRILAENILSSSYIINANMGVNVRLRHYWTKVIYNDFFKLHNSGLMSKLNLSQVQENQLKIFDRKLNLFNVDFEYRWRFRKGSDLILVWKNEINSSKFDYEKTYADDLITIFDKEQSNSISLKLVYYLDVNDAI